MAGPESPHQQSLVHEKLTESVQNEREKQTSSRGVRVASIAVTRTGTYAGARAFGIQMDDHEPQPASESADESLAWLDFLEECRQVLAVSEQNDPAHPATLPPGLFDTASRLRTRTARVLARVMITRLAERLATAPSPEKAVERVPLEVASADSLLQSSAPAVVDPRVRTVQQYVESRHVNSACRLDDVA